MTCGNNNSSFPITLLPNEILKIVLKKVDWKTIISLRLTSTFFNNFIMKNLFSLPKPKMIEFKIKSFYETDNKIKVSLLFNCEYNLMNVNDIYISLNSKEIPEFENLFKKMDFTKVNFIEFDITGKTIIFDIISRYFQQNSSIGTLIIDIKRSPIFESFPNFIKKLKYVSCLHLKKLCFSYQTLPKSCLLPMTTTMEYLFIEECQCTSFVNPEMVNKLFFNNNNLKNIAIFSKCTTFQDDLFKNVRNRQKLTINQKNNHKNYIIYLLSLNDSEDVNRYLNQIFPNKNFIVSQWYTSIHTIDCFNTGQCIVSEIRIDSLF
uniref:F-box domain-containing protein n=1 Tax=Strongyloides stercoralis TaxID=6248 RepID=A0A0K0E8D5_STRER